MSNLKKRYKLLISLIILFACFYYAIYFGWETDRSYEPGTRSWIGKSFRVEKPILMYHTDGWYHNLGTSKNNSLLPNNLDEFRMHPTDYNRIFNSVYLIEPGARFKIIQVFDWSTWVGTFLCIKAVLKSGPYAGKKVTVEDLFDTDRKRIIFGPRKDIPISEL